MITNTQLQTDYVIQVRAGRLRSTNTQLWQDYQTFLTLRDARLFIKKYLAGLRPRIIRRRNTLVK